MRRQHPALDFSLFQLAILRAIQAEDQPSGSEVQDQLSEVWPEHIRNKRIYRNLATLEERGFIESGEVDARTNWYAITDDGREKYDRVVQWFTEVHE